MLKKLILTALVVLGTVGAVAIAFLPACLKLAPAFIDGFPKLGIHSTDWTSPPSIMAMWWLALIAVGAVGYLAFMTFSAPARLIAHVWE